MDVNRQNEILALIARLLAGLADDSEVAQLKEWIDNSRDNKQFFGQLRNIWDASDKQIDLKKINTKEALEKIFKRIPKLSPKRTFWYYWQKVAAIVIIPLAVGTLIWMYLQFYKMNSLNREIYNEVYTAFGTRSSLMLADSSLVWLNSGSSLKYPIKFNNNNRQVFLKGEAYFEVERDVLRPFIVTTSTLQIEATGTKFNVQEYDSSPTTEVTLVSGKLSVEDLENKMNPQFIAKLNPNQHLEYNKQNKAKYIGDEDAYRYVAWKDGKLIFRNEPLGKVLDKISMIFNVKIDLQSKELQEYRYHATFQDESLEEILKLLKLSAPIDYKEVKRNPLPDGSFPKKKVIIFPVKQKM